VHAPPIRGLLTGRPPLELWGGVECTVNRVHDRYFDQTARTGHTRRLDDLDRFAELGIRTLRFPLLWEHVQPESDAAFDWRWTDVALERLRELGIRPIAGLLHHGFGPRWVDALDPDYAERFANYASAVAERYPWIDAYTPINEPLTTARFSGLYGHWHPHARDDGAFTKLLIAQLSATACAMREIRRVNSGAQLVQTEDLGRIASTPALESQRDFENERRWLTWDALSGMLTEAHPCWSYLVGAARSNERALQTLATAPCPPQLIGVNHYITSERYLDERVERYALDEIGGNGREVYADVAQVQVDATARVGLRGLLRETWDRYAIPIAITECHIGCTREEQMRWLGEVWCDAGDARGRGIDVRAVTTWALLGSHDWNSLVTRETDHYEPGAFDARGAVPRPTALAAMVRALASDGRYEHPVLASSGWWHRDRVAAGARPILIADAGGGAGAELATACESRGLAFVMLHPPRFDTDSTASVSHALDAYRPWSVIATAGYAAVLADECARRGLTLAMYDSREHDAHATLDQLLDDDCNALNASALDGAAI
jgi:dTDP-4-dehydrorhamnose reductase